MKRFLLFLTWFVSVSAVLTASFFFLLYSSSPSPRPTPFHPQPNYRFYISLPQVLGAFTNTVESQDILPQTTKDYLKGTPLEPYADYLITTCQKYDLPQSPYPLTFWALAIATVESGVCRRIPPDSHNCWGWGIHSAGTLKFPDYPTAIETFCRDFSAAYLKKGLLTPEQVMSRYIPHSPNGAWAKKIQRILDRLQSPIE